MSDESFTNFRAADGRFARGNPGGPVEIVAPEIRGVPDLVPASAMTNAVLNGDVTPDEGRAAVRGLDRHGNMIAPADLERRMSELEAEDDVEARGRDR
jgi:hypothetical protein